MATVGEKVTETIVNAIGRGVQGTALSHHGELKSLIEGTVDQYLETPGLDPETRKRLEAVKADSTLTDVLTTIVCLVVGIIQEIFTLGEPGAEVVRHGVWRLRPAKFPQENLAVAAWIRGYYPDENAYELLQQTGYDHYHANALRAALMQPAPVNDIVRLWLRGDLTNEEARRDLAHQGYDLHSQTVIMQAARYIPGIPDLIRMAVREAFTPEIAEKFGQYQDFPADVATWAEKQGLATEWAQRYWAAHWELPSVTQGFEMLHRGVIDQATMELLLRAQDVMPFWRDKLTAIAYNPLTRVDVRRMYHLGVLDEAGVTKAYRELGYNAENAARLLEFTKVYYGPEDEDPEEEDREWTKAEILDGYRKRILTADQARTALREMGYPEDKANWYLAREDLKAAQSLKDAYVTRWRNLYINGVASADEVNASLTALGMTEAELAEMLPLWHLDKIMAVQRPTKAEITRWLKAGIITEATWTQEMQLSGFSDRYITWFLAEIKAQPELAIQEEQEG